MRSTLTRQAAFLTSSRVIAQMVNALIGIVLVRALHTIEYATFRQIYLIFLTLQQLADFGFIESLYFFLPRQTENRAAILRTTLVLVLCSQVVMGGLLFILRFQFGHFFNNAQLPECFDLLALFLALSVITRIWEVELVALQRTEFASLIVSGSEFLKALLMGVALVFSASVRPLLWAMVMAALLKVLIFAFYIGKDLRWFANAGNFLKKEHFAYAMGLWAPALVNVMARQAHQFVVGYYFDPAQYAIYAVACFQVPFLLVVSTSVGELLLVRVSEKRSQGDLNDILRVWLSACRKCLLMYVPVILCLAVLAKPLVILLFTPRYAASAPLFAIIVFGLVFNGIFQDAIFRSFGAMRVYALFYLLNGILSVGLAIVGAHVAGLAGVAVSMVLTTAVVNAWQLIEVAKLLNVRFSQVLPWAAIGKIVLSSLIAALVARASAQLFQGYGLALAMGMSAFLTIYGLLAIRMHLIPLQQTLAWLHARMGFFFEKRALQN